jgi:hypothetical protein
MVDNARNIIKRIALKIVGPQVDETRKSAQRETLEL